MFDLLFHNIILFTKVNITNFVNNNIYGVYFQPVIQLWSSNKIPCQVPGVSEKSMV